MHYLTFVNIWLAGVASGLALSPSSDARCAQGVHIIGARGNGTEEGYGAMVPMVKAIQDAIPSSSNISVTYPKGVPANEGNTEGTENFKDLIQASATRCPDTPIVIVGYSEGAGLAMNTICGTTNGGFEATPPLDPQLYDNILAMVVYGDYTYTPGQPWDAASCESNSPWPRGDPGTCDSMGSKIRSYCNAEDPVCCSTGTDPTQHHQYFGQYDDEMAAWVLRRFNRQGD